MNVVHPPYSNRHPSWSALTVGLALGLLMGYWLNFTIWQIDAGNLLGVIVSTLTLIVSIGCFSIYASVAYCFGLCLAWIILNFNLIFDIYPLQGIIFFIIFFFLALITKQYQTRPFSL